MNKLDSNQIKQFAAFVGSVDFGSPKRTPALYSDAGLVAKCADGTFAITKKGRNLLEKARVDGLIKAH